MSFALSKKVMMKIIFECETEVGQCDCERSNTDHFNYAEPGYAKILAHTLATLNNKGLLKIEQHCYLRNGTNVPEQPWVRPTITLEAGIDTEDEMLAIAQTMHQRFLIRTRLQFPEEFLV